MLLSCCVSRGSRRATRYSSQARHPELQARSLRGCRKIEWGRSVKNRVNERVICPKFPRLWRALFHFAFACHLSFRQTFPFLLRSSVPLCGLFHLRSSFAFLCCFRQTFPFLFRSSVPLCRLFCSYFLIFFVLPSARHFLDGGGFSKHRYIFEAF